MAGSRGRLALGVGAALFVALAGVYVHRSLRASLERQARDLDLAVILEQAGLAGRVDPLRWSAAQLRWRPRPRLVLRGVETRVHSGLPGPGETSGTIRLERVELVPALSLARGGGLARVDIAGGQLRIGRDLLPEPPLEYRDPLDGVPRAVPWAAFLEVARVTPPPAAERAGALSEIALAARRPGATLVTARQLDLELVGYDLIPDRTFSLDRAEVAISAGRVDLRGMLRATDRRDSSLLVPFLLRHEHLPSGSQWWETRLGPGGSGLRVAARAESAGSASSWTIDLQDPEGRVVAAVLSARAGALRRLRWAGPWSLEVEGEGAFPQGIRLAEMELLSGRFRTDGDSLPVAVARGRLRILPGRVDLMNLVLRSPHASGDSASLSLAWVRTAEGHSVTGRLQGRIDPAWLTLLGADWSASGRLDCDLTFTGRRGADAHDWSLVPRGTCRGVLERLGGPWFADTLRQGRFEAWAHSRGLGCVAVGVWGRSPFRLEARDLPLPGPDYLERVAAGGRWDLRSTECRLEDFRLSPERFRRVAPAPFWLGLPGRGSIRIETGSLAETPFERLRASVYRSRGRTRIDSLEVEIGDGRIRNAAADAFEPRPEGHRPTSETRLRAERLDLGLLQTLLRAGGVSLPGRPRGQLSGDFRIRWARPGEDAAAVRLDASVVVVDGSLRGLPALEALARRSGVPELEPLAFRELRFDLRREPGLLAWSRLRLSAPPIQVEGAGHVAGADWLEAFVALRLEGGVEGDPLVSLLRGILDGERSALYLGLRGPKAAPEVSWLTRGEYLRGLDETRGVLRSEGLSLRECR